MRRQIITPTNLQMSQVTDDQFKIYTNAKDDEVAVMIFDGYVGDEYTETDARSFEHFLADNIDKPVVIKINSVGGLAYDGVAIHNALAAHPKETHAIITGQAASAAALLSQGADVVTMYENASFMIHRANLVTWGNRHGLMEDVENLDLLDKAIAASLASRTGLPPNDIMALMDGEGKRDGTTMDAERAVELGFADNIVSVAKKAEKATAAVDHTPQAKRNWRNEVAVRLRTLEASN